jgi:hypothetical protein
MMVGGKSGKVLIPGSPMTSELFKRIMLPEDDKKHMPPKDKPQLSKEEADIIHWWINAARASATVRLSDVKIDEAIQTVLATWYAEDSKAAPVTDPDPLPDLELPEVSADVVDSLEKNGFVVSFIVQGKPFISINCVNIPDLTDEGLARLLPVKNHILWLNASDTKVTDTGMALIGEMTNLLRLNVANTRVTSDGLSRIRDITGLRNLNLVGTAVSDDAVPVLEKMASLNTLYLWKTRISSKGIQHLQSVLPNTSINAGESRLP